jgi:hypothetical protein
VTSPDTSVCEGNERRGLGKIGEFGQ